MGLFGRKKKIEDLKEMRQQLVEKEFTEQELETVLAGNNSLSIEHILKNKEIYIAKYGKEKIEALERFSMSVGVPADESVLGMLEEIEMDQKKNGRI